MKKTIWTSTCTAVVGVATATVLGAQAPTTTQQQPTSTPPAAASAEKTITVVGCLRAAPSSSADTAASATAGTTGTAGTTTTAGTTGTTGTAGTAGTATAGTTASTPAAPAAADSAQQKFILTEAGPSAADAGTTSTAGAAAAPTTTAGSAQKETYQLVANGSALSPHVGKKLELTGTLEANGASATDSTSGPDAGRPTIRVQSGRIVAASCDAK